MVPGVGSSDMKFTTNCVVPENIPTHPLMGHWKFAWWRRRWGSSKDKSFNVSMKLDCDFRRGGRTYHTLCGSRKYQSHPKHWKF